MWVHWLECLKIVSSLSCLSKGYIVSFVVSYRLFVVFNNANAVSAEMWVWGFGNHAWYKSLVKSLVFDSWLGKTFVSLVISKTPYSHFRTHSISIVEKYKQSKRNYKWEEISFSKLNVLIYDSKSQCSHMWVHWLLLDSLVFTSILQSM